MARGWVIERGLSKSDKLNALWGTQDGQLAIIIYCLSYPLADSWGHLPFEATWVRRECLCDYGGPIDAVRRAMLALLTVGLWEYAYQVGSKYYVYISQFEERARDGIRHRRVGQYPDESGAVPRRLADENIEQSLERSATTRGRVRPVTFRDVPKHSEISREVTERGARDMAHTNGKGQIPKHSETSRDVTA